MSSSDTEIKSNASSTWALGISFALILTLAAFLRIHSIALRPMHNDEGVNHHFIKEMMDKGYYPYSHENYHGPAYFYFTRLMVAIGGESELALRSSAIVAGLLTILMLLCLRKREGGSFVLVTASILALSSSLVFYSRYAIHESLFLLSGAAAALSIYGYYAERIPKNIYSGFVALAVLIATKETFIVTLFSLGFATILLGDWKSLYQNLRRDQQHLFYGALIAILLIALCFTGGFQWPGGLREMLLAVPQWIGRNKSDVGHFKPFIQYFVYFKSCEPLVLVGLGLGLISVLARFVVTRDEWPNSGFVAFCGAWAVSAMLAYSFIKYKTPWLMINITLPALLVLSWWLTWAFTRSLVTGAVLMTIALAVSASYVKTFNFTIPYGNNNLFSYVQTTDGMTNCVSDIENYWKTHSDSRVLIGVGGYWPLPYYFRDFANRVEYLVPKDADVERLSDKYGVMILDSSSKWAKDGWTWKYYRLSDVQEAHVYFRRK